MSVVNFQRIRQRPEFSLPIITMVICLFFVSAAVVWVVPYREYVPPKLYMTSDRFNARIVEGARGVRGEIVRTSVNRQDAKSFFVTTWVACDADRVDLVSLTQPLFSDATRFQDAYCQNSSTSSEKVMYEFQRPSGFLRIEADIDASEEWNSIDSEGSKKIYVRLNYVEQIRP